MKPYDRIIVIEDSPDDEIVKGQTGVITDLCQGDDVIVAMLELDDGSFDDSDDEGLRSCAVSLIKVIEPAKV